MLWGSHQPPMAEEQLSPPGGCTEPEPRRALPVPQRPRSGSVCSRSCCRRVPGAPTASARPAAAAPLPGRRAAPLSSANITDLKMPFALRVHGKMKGWFAYREP